MKKEAHNAFQKVFGVIIALCLALHPFLSALATTVSSATVESAPITTASTSVDGMVRVYLSSLGSPTSLTLTVQGNYSLSTGTTLTSGETLYVGFSSSTGAITLTRNGIKTNMGSYFALRRHSATGTNGILISQARQPSNPYPGDISFQAVYQSGGYYKLYTVAHIYIENYLYGVLPYEMGNSAALEALKAQAVAARTYTVRMMANRSSGYYDVVDTTGDQTYNGTPSGYTACETAVDSTKGIILKNGSSYTATYYSASNGGQTESIYNIWGSSGYSYLDVHDDPFDYANPYSTVKKTTVYADCNSSSNNTSLMSLLKAKAVTALAAAGYSATSSNTTLGTITNIVAHTPKYSSPSRLYTKMDFTLTASTRNTYGTLVTATTTVTCDIFSELESLLSMSIQSSSNELWTVTKSSSIYTLEARRYGHGLGLSQRGAMYMGTLGYTYDEILGFYYPDCTRVRTTFTNTILAADSTEEITTEEEAATIEDADDDAYSAVVTLISSSSSLAIRASKSTSGTMLGVVAGSSPVTVYANDGTWCLIKFGSIIGYVPTNALTISGTAPETSEEEVTSIDGFATVTASSYLNLRSSGSYSASIVSTAPSGAILTVLSKGSSWSYIQYGAIVAYACSDYLSFSSSYGGAVVSSGVSTATVTTSDGSATYLRATASTSGTVLAQVANGSTVSVSSDDGSWAVVTYNGVTGYILSSLLAMDSDEEVSTGTDTVTYDDLADGEFYATIADATANLLESQDEAANVIAEIAMGQSVVVTEQGDTWCAIRYEGETGYILTASLTIVETTTETSLTAIVATQSGSLNMRMEGRAGSTILTTIPKGATVMVTNRGDTWCGVTYGGYSGYVMTVYLQFTDGSEADGESVTSGTTATVTTESGSLNLRQLPKTGSTILTTIPRLGTLTVNTYGSEWCYITYNGITGYVMTVFLTMDSEGDDETSADDTDSEDTADDDTAAEDGDDTTDEEATQDDTTADDTSTDDTTASDTETDATQTDNSTITAIVTTASGSLNLRADMLPGSRILTRIPNKTTITVLAKYAAWSQTSYNGYTGYVMNSYLTFVTDTDTTDASAATATVMTASGSLNLRAEPYGTVLTTIPQYATVSILQHGSTWCYLQYAGTYGYSMTAYLSFTAESVTTDTDAEDDTATEAGDTQEDTAEDSETEDATSATETTAYVYTSSGSLNLRLSASTGASILTTIPRLTVITVLETGDTWCKVTYSSYTGYVQTTYLQFIAGTEESTSDTGTVTAWVYTSSGSLNLRASASISASVITTIPRLAEVALLTQGDTWCKTMYGTYVGYAMTSYLTTTKPDELSSSEADDQSEPDGRDASDSAGTDAEDTTTEDSSGTDESDADTGDGETADETDTGSDETALEEAAAAEETGDTTEEDSADGESTGEAAEDPTLTTPDTTLYATVTPVNSAVALTLWESCTDQTGWLLDMASGKQVQVIRQGDTWCEVRYLNTQGFCLTEGLTMIE